MDKQAKQPDWIAIEGEYRAGMRPLRAIASDHGIAEGTIRARAKKGGWTRDAAATKRAIVAAKMSGLTQEVAQNVMRNIEAAALEDIQDMERGIRIGRMCLLNLEASAANAEEPREIKVIIEATSSAIDTIRKIRGLDESSPAKTHNTDDEDDARATAIAERLEARVGTAAA